MRQKKNRETVVLVVYVPAGALRYIVWPCIYDDRHQSAVLQYAGAEFTFVPAVAPTDEITITVEDARALLEMMRIAGLAA